MWSRNFTRGLLNRHPLSILQIHRGIPQIKGIPNVKMTSSKAGIGGAFQPIKEKQAQNQPGYVTSSNILFVSSTNQFP